MNPYTPPHSPIERPRAARPRSTRTAIAGAWLQLAPIAGSVAAVLAMQRAFKGLGSEGVGDPSQVARAIGEVMISSALGFWGGLIGCVLLGLAVFRQKCTARWVKILFWLSLLPALYGTLMLLMALIAWLGEGPGS